MPHPCVLFSSSPYLRYILGEKILNVNPKLTFSSQLFISGNRANVSFPGIKIPGNRAKGPPSRPPQLLHYKKSPRGVQRGRGFAAPLRFSFFPQKKYCTPFAKKANATQYLKKSISNLLLLYLTTRTLYIPSISLSSSNALADAALSRSIRV